MRKETKRNERSSRSVAVPTSPFAIIAATALISPPFVPASSLDVSPIPNSASVSAAFDPAGTKT
jgi:hypothetical protein